MVRVEGAYTSVRVLTPKSSEELVETVYRDLQGINEVA
jgi:putative lipoic acid-binding regulatory protein